MNRREFIERCNGNEYLAYPLADGCTMTDDHGREFPMSLLTELHICVPDAYSDTYLSSFHLSGHVAGISLACEEDGVQRGIATLSVARSEYTPCTAAALTPLVDDVSGWAVFGDMDSVSEGLWKFSSSEQSGLDPRAVKEIRKPSIDAVGIPGIRNEDMLGGVVELAAEGPVHIDTDTDTNTITIGLDASDASRFMSRCGVRGDSSRCHAIRSINGVEGPVVDIHVKRAVFGRHEDATA